MAGKHDFWRENAFLQFLRETRYGGKTGYGGKTRFCDFGGKTCFCVLAENAFWGFDVKTCCDFRMKIRFCKFGVKTRFSNFGGKMRFGVLT